MVVLGREHDFLFKSTSTYCGCTVGLLAQHSTVAAGSWALQALRAAMRRNSRCDDSTQQLSMPAAAAAPARRQRQQNGHQNEGRGGRWQRCGSYGGARQTGGSRQACFVKVEGTQLWRTRNRKLLLKLTRGTSIVMEFQAMKKEPSRNICAHSPTITIILVPGKK